MTKQYSVTFDNYDGTYGTIVNSIEEVIDCIENNDDICVEVLCIETVNGDTNWYDITEEIM